jgi:hypothetical protein
VTKRVISSGNTSVRVALVLPFAALVLSGAALFVASLTTFGVASSVGYAGWVPPAGGLIMALPLIAAGLVAGSLVWRRIEMAYRVYLGRLLPAWILLFAIAGLGVAYIVTINNPETYQGSYNDLTGKYEANLTVETFFFASILLSVFIVGAVYLAMRFLYLPAVERPGLEVPEGIDPTGALINERLARR